MYSFEKIQSLVNEKIGNCYLSGNPDELYEPIRYMMSLGGKRIRPVLTIMACNLYSDEIKESLNPSVGLEVFHNFTLVHDDIMDNATLRRNKPTVYKKWNSNIAVLSGDAMLIKSYEFFFDLKRKVKDDVLKVFNKTALEVCEGQQYDMNFESRNDVSEKEYIEMIRLKTAVLIAASLKIGGIIGGADREDAENLYLFGENLGLAFQLRDDFLDVFGNEQKFGKNIGGDIVSNKKTYLLISALQNADEKEYKSIISWLNKNKFDHDQKITFFKKIYSDLKIDDLVQNKIDEYHHKAKTNLLKLSVSRDRLKPLMSLSELMMKREY